MFYSNTIVYNLFMKIDESLKRPLIGLLFFIAFCDFLAQVFYLYWIVWWLDVPMHILGGMFAGLFFLAVFRSLTASHPFKESFIITLAVAILGALIIGLLWEVYESIAGVTYSAFGGRRFDIIKDVMMDLAGGSLTALLFSRSSGGGRKFLQ